MNFCWLRKHAFYKAESFIHAYGLNYVLTAPVYMALLAFTPNAVAENQPLCVPIDSTASTQALPELDEANHEQINISADATRTSSDGSSKFEGNVIIEKHQLRINTETAEYNQQEGSVQVSGKVHVDTKNMSFDAESGSMMMGNELGQFDNVKFFTPKSGMHGSALSIISADDSSSELKGASITTCDPENPDWSLGADTIKLNHADEYGSAKHVVLKFKDIPFFYAPYMEFPLGDKRRSGLLVPEFSDSSSRGFELSVPWYWNIAPNQDAIISPHYMRKRGLQLDTQYRYLTSSSSGELNAFFLPDDDVTNEDRHHLRYVQNSRLTTNLHLDIDAQDVSDINYFDDFNNSLFGSSITHLNRSLSLNYATQYWRAKGIAQTYETVDSSILISDRPYRMLPQLTLTGDQPIADTGFSLTLDSEWVGFDHEDSTIITGSRFNLRPGLQWLTQGASWYLKPSIQFDHAQYDVEDSSGTKLDIEDRNLSITSIDTGLFFERKLAGGLLQTLEPRLYYLNIPFHDQSALPLFDTSDPDFSISQLFRYNRFNGRDRIGDTEQLTMALSSRLIDPQTGDEFMRASVGQILYFDDRLVTLDNTTETNNRSDLIAEVSGNWQKWTARASVQWDTETDKAEKENVVFHYKGNNRFIFNAGYRLRRSTDITTNDIKQTDLSIVAPIGSKYRLFGRWNYSLEQERDIDVIAGLSYESCCWSIQLINQRHLQNTNTQQEYDTSFMIQLVLKGLGSVSGNRASNTLKNSILGYDEDY